MRKAHLAAALFAGVVSACAPLLPPPEEGPVQAPADFPERYYQETAAQGKAVFRVDPARSIIVIEARRGGSLVRFGHDHVIASHDVTGYVAPGEGRADLYVPLERLVVDEAELRAQAGFDTTPSEADIAGTRANMLEQVLQTRQHPFALVHLRGVAASGASLLNVAITLRGVTRERQVPAQIEAGTDGFGASGSLALNQTDFGIPPFSILGGAIRVQDRLDLRFRILAVPLD
ncbi:MAG: YceI family protein [Betaproteobacteria bacterium]|nr:YceI family protein [Betaproteobacteria bacterium]MBI2960239.1 YceI family protein [Betaproteobacteria bacterium]